MALATLIFSAIAALFAFLGWLEAGERLKQIQSQIREEQALERYLAKVMSKEQTKEEGANGC